MNSLVLLLLPLLLVPSATTGKAIPLTGSSLTGTGVFIPVCVWTNKTGRRVEFVNEKEDDRLRMCPPGGSSFTMAWSMACSMRRKRSAEMVRGTRLVSNLRRIIRIQRRRRIAQKERRALVAPSIRQLQTICCEVGCTITDLLPYCGPLSAW